MGVGVALIVRNEAAALPGCLEAVRPGVEEIVVVDTGSTDETIAIARRYTDRVYEFAWIDDFSAARQFAFDQITADWVCWLDADDRIVGADRLPDLTAAAGSEVGGFQFPTVMSWDAVGRPAFTFWRERCVRNDGGYRWAGRVHEVLIPRDDAPARTFVRVPEITVEHRPETRDITRDPARNIRILEEVVAGDPSSRDLYYLAREYADRGDPERALVAFDRYQAVATWADERYLAYRQVADLHRLAGRYEAALDAEFQAVRIHPRWPDAYFGLAETAYYRQAWATVVHWIDIGRSLPEPDTLLFRDAARTSFAWIIHYTIALHGLGRYADALVWTRRALDIDPTDPWHTANERIFLALLSDATP